jgi:hypothetical protein
MKVAITIAPVALAVLFVGCSTYRVIPRSDLRPDSQYGAVRVATFDGFEYRFKSIAVRPDTLDGFYTETVERTGGKNDVWYEDAVRVQKIPLVRVARVELMKKDPMKTAFYGASLAAGAYFLASVASDNGPKTRRIGGNGGKGGGLPP